MNLSGSFGDIVAVLTVTVVTAATIGLTNVCAAIVDSDDNEVSEQ